VKLDPLRRGDVVDIVAPASACSRMELRNGLKAIRALGLIPACRSIFLVSHGFLPIQMTSA